MVYAILNCEKGFVLEQFQDEKFEVFQLNKKDGFIVYKTKDVLDEELLRLVEANDIKTIIWRRYYHRVYKVYMKVEVPFTPHDFSKMGELSDNFVADKEEEIQRLLAEKEERKIKQQEANFDKIMMDKKNQRLLVEEQNLLIPSDMDEMEAIFRWAELNYKLPAADRITEIKKSYNLSWGRFKEFCMNIIIKK